jgi:hypothetical protein
MRLITIPQILIARWVMALCHPARSDALALAHLVLDADTQIAVIEDELVEAERLPDPFVPVTAGSLRARGSRAR